MKACKNPSQIESHRIYLISPVSCDNTCEILLTKKLTEDLARFLFRASQGFSGSSAGKESICNAGDPSLITGWGRSTGEGIGYPLQYSWASLVAQTVRICLQCRRHGFDPWVGEIPWRRDRLPTPVFLGFTGAQTVKNPPAMWETWVQSLGWEDPLEECRATHSSILAWRIPMDRVAWGTTVHGVAKSRTRMNT